jgi:hypothetical protein
LVKITVDDLTRKHMSAIRSTSRIPHVLKAIFVRIVIGDVRPERRPVEKPLNGKRPVADRIDGIIAPARPYENGAGRTANDRRDDSLAILR